jgi:hypothetical protein
MTNKRLYSWIVCGFLAVLPLAVAGCNDLGSPDDVTNAQEQSRMNRGIPAPTELPPGLGDDLPPPVSTQPQPPTH